LLCAQAFVPRLGTYRASSVHYYNLATVEEQLGRNDAALRHYRVAMERNADQPMFALRFAHLSRLLHHDADAERAFRQVANMAKAPRAVRELAARELQDLAKQPRAAP
jgi:tetratricopeptide (TPR) repeat protein